MQSITLVVFACAMATCLVTSSPVYPAIHLRNFNPIDICLFVCNICFSDEMDSEMMDCANNVCLAKTQYQMSLGMLKIGRNCKNMDKLDKYVLNNNTE